MLCPDVLANEHYRYVITNLEDGGIIRYSTSGDWSTIFRQYMDAIHSPYYEEQTYGASEMQTLTPDTVQAVRLHILHSNKRTHSKPINPPTPPSKNQIQLAP